MESWWRQSPGTWAFHRPQGPWQPHPAPEGTKSDELAGRLKRFTSGCQGPRKATVYLSSAQNVCLSVSAPSLLAVPTHHQREAPVLRVEAVEAQVEDQRGYGVEEGKDAQGHEELGRGREVPHEVHGLGGGLVVAERHLILDPVQPAGGQGAHPELRGLSLWRQWALPAPRAALCSPWDSHRAMKRGMDGGKFLGGTVQSRQECPWNSGQTRAPTRPPPPHSAPLPRYVDPA